MITAFFVLLVIILALIALLLKGIKNELNDLYKQQRQANLLAETMCNQWHKTNERLDKQNQLLFRIVTEGVKQKP